MRTLIYLETGLIGESAYLGRFLSVSVLISWGLLLPVPIELRRNNNIAAPEFLAFNKITTYLTHLLLSHTDEVLMK